MIVNLSPFLLKSPHTWCLSTKHLHGTFGHVFLWRTAGTNFLALPSSHSHTHLSGFFCSQWICYVLKYNSSFPSLSSWTNWKKKIFRHHSDQHISFYYQQCRIWDLGLPCEQSQTFHYLWIKWPQHYLQISWWSRAFTGKHSMGETAFILRIGYFQRGNQAYFFLLILVILWLTPLSACGGMSEDYRQKGNFLPIRIPSWASEWNFPLEICKQGIRVLQHLVSIFAMTELLIGWKIFRIFTRTRKINYPVRR